MQDRGAVAVETLLKVLLVLVVAWLAIDVAVMIDPELLIAPFKPIVGLVVVVLLVLKLLDQI